MGHRNRSAYRAVVIDSRKARDDGYFKSVGHYDLRTKLMNLNTRRIGSSVSECKPAPESGATETARLGNAERQTHVGTGARTREGEDRVLDGSLRPQ